VEFQIFNLFVLAETHDAHEIAIWFMLLVSITDVSIAIANVAKHFRTIFTPVLFTVPVNIASVSGFCRFATKGYVTSIAFKWSIFLMLFCVMFSQARKDN